jgi:hypothetical protein
VPLDHVRCVAMSIRVGVFVVLSWFISAQFAGATSRFPRWSQQDPINSAYEFHPLALARKYLINRILK